MRFSTLLYSLTFLILANSASAHHTGTSEGFSAANIAGILLLIVAGLAISLIFRISSKVSN